MSVRLRFLGAAGTVTGSRTLVRHERGALLVDDGLFQGFKQYRQLNWRPQAVDVEALDGVVLTHAHLDHSGALPLLVRQGFRGPIHATRATADLCRVLWPDAAWLQEEEAERANRRGTSRHRPAKPLFDRRDAERAAELLVEHRWHEPFQVGAARVTFRRAGHILGAASALVEVEGRTLLFSGDLGRPVDPIHRAPDPLPVVDTLVLESTYGDRLHPDVDAEQALGEVVRRVVARGGHVMVPSFAVGRTQRLLLHLYRLRQRGEVPDVPVYLNSPLADRATDVFLRHPEAHDLSPEEARGVSELPRIVRTPDESKALNRLGEPAILIAGSGMATGGRIVHHLAAYGPDPKHAVVLAGFQAPGTRGDRILRGEPTVRIFGEDVPIRCERVLLDNLSAHADRDELVAWVRAADRLPGRIVLNHGTPEALDGLRVALERKLGATVEVPMHGDEVEG